MMSCSALGWNFTELGEFDPIECFQSFFGIVAGMSICGGCSPGFRQPIGKEGDVKQRYFQAALAGPAVTSETRAGCRLSGKQFLFRCAYSGTAFYISHGGAERKRGSLCIRLHRGAELSRGSSQHGSGRRRIAPRLLGGIGVAVCGGPWTPPSKVPSLSECGNGKAALCVWV